MAFTDLGQFDLPSGAQTRAWNENKLEKANINFSKMVDKLTEKQIEELKEAFKLFDHNTGFIELRELPNLLRSIGQNPRPEEIRSIGLQVYLRL